MSKSTKYLKILCNLLAALAALLVIIFVLPRALVFFMPFVVGFILSLIANPVVKFMEKKIKMKRKYGSALIIILVIAAVVLVCYGVGLALVMGLRSFADYLPTMFANAEQELIQAGESIGQLLQKIPFLQDFDMQNVENALQKYMNELVSGTRQPTVSVIGDIAKSIPNVLVSLVMGLLATYFFIADRDNLAEALQKHLPHSFREKTMQMYTQILKAVGGYFKAQLKIMGVMYVVLTIGLMILGVNYAWLIGFGIAVLDMLPVFGTGTVLIPWAVIKFFSGNLSTAVGMVVLYVVSLLAHQLIQPKLIGESVGMNTFATLFFMYIGYQFGGVLGLIVAIPIGMLLINFYKAGAFDGILWCIREILKDFNEFRRLPK